MFDYFETNAWIKKRQKKKKKVNQKDPTQAKKNCKNFYAGQDDPKRWKMT